MAHHQCLEGELWEARHIASVHEAVPTLIPGAVFLRKEARRLGEVLQRYFAYLASSP